VASRTSANQITVGTTAALVFGGILTEGTLPDPGKLGEVVEVLEV
jgi:hypothetical protein